MVLGKMGKVHIINFVRLFQGNWELEMQIKKWRLLGTFLHLGTGLKQENKSDIFRVKHVSSGGNHSLAITHDNQLYCWSVITFQ